VFFIILPLLNIILSIEVGMYAVQKSLLSNTGDSYSFGTTKIGSSPMPIDPWLFTDPSAIGFYLQLGLIEQLEEDIRTYVMSDGSWGQDELELKSEIQRMLGEGLVAPESRIGYLSPHPTIYRALKEGVLNIYGRRYRFVKGEDLVFEPWLARYSHPAQMGPLRIGQSTMVSKLSLCCEIYSHVCIHCDNTRTVMRKILSYRNNGK
jgi:hypothetical protein